jgi:hypothetical protein
VNETPAKDIPVAPGERRSRAKRLIATALLGASVAAILLYTLAPLASKPVGLPTGVTLAAFQRQLARDLAKPESRGGFDVAGVASLECVPPASWTPGKSFTCFAFRKDDVELGTLSGRVRASLAGAAWSASLKWNAGT